MSRGHIRDVKSWEEMEFYKQAGAGGRGECLMWMEAQESARLGRPWERPRPR